MTSYEVSDFQKDVLERSYHTPVVADFWAPWCASCRMLGPVLVRLATNSNRWVLVTINTDNNPSVATSLGIRGIPAVKLFVDGEVISEFTGVQPEATIRAWIDKSLPGTSLQRLKIAEDALTEGRWEEAERILRELFSLDPADMRIRLRLAQILVCADPDQATTLLPSNGVEPDLLPLVNAIRTLFQEMRRQELPNQPGKAAYLRALAAIREQHFDDAYDHLIQVLQTDRYYDDDSARKTGIALFIVLGEKHPVTQRHRRNFNMWLY